MTNRGWPLRPRDARAASGTAGIRQEFGNLITINFAVARERHRSTIRRQRRRCSLPEAPGAGAVRLRGPTALSPPFGSLFGTAIQPREFGRPPRRNVTVEPSSEIERSESTTPSSSVNSVILTGLKSAPPRCRRCADRGRRPATRCDQLSSRRPLLGESRRDVRRD